MSCLCRKYIILYSCILVIGYELTNVEFIIYKESSKKNYPEKNVEKKQRRFKSSAKACAGQARREMRATESGEEENGVRKVASAKQWASTKRGDSVRGSRKKSVGNDNERLAWRDNRQVSYSSTASREPMHIHTFRVSYACGRTHRE